MKHKHPKRNKHPKRKDPMSVRIATEECAQRVENFWRIVRQEAFRRHVGLTVQDGSLWISDLRRPAPDQFSDGWPFVARIADDGSIEFSEIFREEFPEDFNALAKARGSGRVW